MIELTVAFGAGLISFLSPCVLPLIPGYISYISGSSLNELLEKKSINLIPILLFTLGFSIFNWSFIILVIDTWWNISGLFWYSIKILLFLSVLTKGLWAKHFSAKKSNVNFLTSGA